jgi:tRNA-Thr(GGU) m(6)t(6)A37 methyltransferase TsaA
VVSYLDLHITPIGIIRTPLEASGDAPIQSAKSEIPGEVAVDEEYIEGLESLDGFSHAILLYWFHRAKPPTMKVKPYLDSQEHGLFSTRAPSRPNPIGLSVVRIVEINGGLIRFTGADMLDGTPLLDIKPFVPEFDNRLDAASGWLSSSSKRLEDDHMADGRF